MAHQTIGSLELLHKVISAYHQLKLTDKIITNRFVSWTIRAISAAITMPLLLGGLEAYVGHQEPYLEISNRSHQALPSNIKVMSYNIAGGRGRPFEWTRDLFLTQYSEISAKGITGIEQTISQESPQIVCLNETEISGLRGENQTRSIAKNTGLTNYVFASNITFKAKYLSPKDGSYRSDLLADGNSLLSTASLQSVIHIPSFEYAKPLTWSTLFDWVVGTEGVIHAAVPYGASRINLYCVHLSSWEFDPLLPVVSTDSDREIEVQQLASMIAAPAIVMGDFNSVPEASQHISYGADGQKYYQEKTWWKFKQILDKRGLSWGYSLDGMVNANFRAVYPGTYLGSVPLTKLGEKNDRPERNERIDYIFVINNPRQPLQLKIDKIIINCERLNSDHCTVIGYLEAIDTSIKE